MKKEEFRIYIFRHGQTTFNRDEKFTGLRFSTGLFRQNGRI
jgi:broad specificity phosphatase PhoE